MNLFSLVATQPDTGYNSNYYICSAFALYKNHYCYQVEQ